MNSRRNANDRESGIALPLAIIMVLLVSVVGAGLLTFVVSDLDSAAETQRGQQAFGVADAGIAAAQDHMESTSFQGDSDPWVGNERTVVIEDEGEIVGEAEVEIDGSQAAGYEVTSTGGASGDSSRKVVADFSATPEETTEPEETTDLEETTEPEEEETPEQESGEVFIPQMVYSLGGTNARETTLDGISAYSAGDLDFANGGKLTMRNASAFSGGNIYFQNGSLSALNMLLNPPLVTSGTDPFGDWKACDPDSDPPVVFNCTARPASADNKPGLGAVGRIKDKYASAQPPNMGTRNFDSSTTSSKKFVATPSDPQPSNQITFPFDENVVPNNLDSLMANLKEESRSQPTLLSASPSSRIAASQGNYIEVNGSAQEVRICSALTGLLGCGSGGLNVVWPQPTDDVPYPVVYVKFNQGDASGNGDGGKNLVRWSVLAQANVGTSLPPLTGLTHELLCKTLRGDPVLGLVSVDVSKDGILVIENGDFVWEGAAGPVPLAPLDGGVVIKSGDAGSKSFLGRNASCMRGPVIADGGGIDLQNPALFGALSDVEFQKLPGFYIPPEPAEEPEDPDDETTEEDDSDESPDPPPEITRESWRESYE